MKHIKQCVGVVLVIIGVCGHSVQSAFNVSMRNDNAQSAYHLYRIKQHVDYLYKALDPFFNHTNSPIFPFLQTLSQEYQSIYTLLQDVYRVLTKKDMNTQLHDMPLFSVLTDDRVQNILLYGDESGQTDSQLREDAQKRFISIVRLIMGGSENNSLLHVVVQQSEYYKAEDMIAFLHEQVREWWQDSLDDFRRKAQGDYVEEVANVIDRQLHAIEAYQVPASFAFYAMPRFLGQLAEQKHEDVRKELVEDNQAQNELAQVLKDEIAQAEQIQQQSQSSGIGEDELQVQRKRLRKVEQEQKTQPQAQPQSAHGITQDVLQNIQLRKTSNDVRASQDKEWWKNADFKKTLQDQGVIDEQAEGVDQGLKNILRDIDAQQATEWFRHIFLKEFLEVLSEDEHFREPFINSKAFQENIKQSMKYLLDHNGKDQFSLPQRIQFDNLTKPQKMKNYLLPGDDDDIEDDFDNDFDDDW